MKVSRRAEKGFYNQSLELSAASDKVKSLNLHDIVREMKCELRCLLRDTIDLHIGEMSDGSCRVKARRGEIEDLIRHLVLDARDAMPTGGALCILTGMVALDAEYTRTHSEVPAGDYVLLIVRDTGDGSNAASLQPLEHKTDIIRKGRSLALTACYAAIDRLGGHLCISRCAQETVTKIYWPRA